MRSKYILSLAVVFSGCAQSNGYFGSSQAGPTPFEQYHQASKACVLSISPVTEIQDIMYNYCGKQGVDIQNDIEVTKCVAPELKKKNAAAFKKYPILHKIQKTALSLPKNVSSTEAVYIEAGEKIQADFIQFLTAVRDQNPLSITQCENQAMTTYLAPSSSAPSAFYAFAAVREDIALKLQTNKISKAKAKIENDKAMAQLIAQLEIGNNQRRHEALMQAQVDAANSQAAAARSMAFQQAMQNFNAAMAPKPQYFPRTTTCNRFGNTMNCNSW